MKKRLFGFLTFIFLAVHAHAFSPFTKRPQLLVIIVIDQFRADYLSRFQNRFLSAGTDANPGGFRYLMENGAYYPLAEYDIVQTATCPGHAMIATGAKPHHTGIPANKWYDMDTRKMVYCDSDPVDKRSPRKLASSTIGDELKLAGYKTKVASVSLKSRASIMLGGHAADTVLWMEEQNFWTTSTYYDKGKLPAFVSALNEKMKNYKVDDIETTTLGAKVTTDAALAMLKEMNLGKEGPDVLAISYSAHDIVGHAVGPNNKAMEEMTIFEDKELSSLFKAINARVGLENVLFVLTGDHGVAPTIERSQSFGLDAGRLQTNELSKDINKALDEKFGSPKEPWFLADDHFHYYLNPAALKERKILQQQAEVTVKQFLTNRPGIAWVWTQQDYEQGLWPPGALGDQLKVSYIPGKSGDILVIPKPFWYDQSKDNSTTHITGYSYDRHVPLLLKGPGIKKGVYAEKALIIDAIPTVSLLLGVLPPALNEGRVLSECLDLNKKNVLRKTKN